MDFGSLMDSASRPITKSFISATPAQRTTLMRLASFRYLTSMVRLSWAKAGSSYRWTFPEKARALQTEFAPIRTEISGSALAGSEQGTTEFTLLRPKANALG